jgi:hypothetical protein
MMLAMAELSDTNDFSWHYNELLEAFNNSKQKESLEEEFKELMNKYSMVQARGTAAVSSSHAGQRISMSSQQAAQNKNPMV